MDEAMILVVTPNPCLDRTLFVEENRVGGKIMVRRVQEIAGGKGSNVCRVLKELGYPAMHLLYLGGYVGERVLTLLEGEGIQSIAVWTRASTRVVVTVVDQRWQQTVYFDPPPEITREEEEVFLARFDELQRKAEMVLLCGSVPPTLLQFYERVLERTQKKVIIDGRGRVLRALKRYPSGLKMNREEAELTWGEKLRGIGDWERFFNFFFERGVEVVILTLGSEGALLGTQEGFYRAMTPRIDVVNPVGSGDAFLGALVYGFCRSLPWGESLQWAVAAGACNAMVWEAGRVKRSCVEALHREVVVEKVRNFGELRLGLGRDGV
ncbi:MAG: 1-phosphofructokinase family hexose kinase [Candidatus Caldatribacteriaceae bacterium]